MKKFSYFFFASLWFFFLIKNKLFSADTLYSVFSVADVLFFRVFRMFHVFYQFILLNPWRSVFIRGFFSEIINGKINNKLFSCVICACPAKTRVDIFSFFFTVSSFIHSLPEKFKQYNRCCHRNIQRVDFSYLWN
jgi:hypothetical protein